MEGGLSYNGPKYYIRILYTSAYTPTLLPRLAGKFGPRAIKRHVKHKKSQELPVKAHTGSMKLLTTREGPGQESKCILSSKVQV